MIQIVIDLKYCPCRSLTDICAIHYHECYEDDICSHCPLQAIGTPLPEHHGRLVDVDDLYENTDICHSEDGFAYVTWKDINDAPTIIEGSDSE